MRLVTRIGIAIVLVLLLLGSLPGAEAAGTTTYDLRVKLDFARGELNVTEKVVYLNRSAASLNSVAFNVSPAHFKAFKLLSAKVDGQTADSRIEDVSLEVVLPYALDPGEFVEIELQFDLNVPNQGGRFGKYDNVMTLGNWFPLASVYREGWDKHPYTPFGDPFNSEVADYDVTVESQSGIEIAHTGKLVRREGNTWQIRAEKVRDFAMAVSDRYEAKSVNVDGISVTAYNLRGRPEVQSLYLDATALALRWLNKTLGTYPYESFHIAEVNPGKEGMVGQEYPNLVFISSAYSGKPEGVKSYTGYLIVHEVVHQWFYGVVGNDQLREPWIDETLATYLAYRILEWAPLSLSSPAVSPSGQSPVNSTVFDFKDETQYFSTTYGKGTVFMQDLAAAMKPGGLDEALREFYNLFKYKTTTSRSLLGMLQSRASTNLNPLMRRYFSFPEYRSDAPLKVEVEWPAGDSWTGVVSIGLKSESPVKRVEIDGDGIPLLRTANASSPLTVDVSKLVDGEYVVGLAAYDDNSRAAFAARRIKVSGGLAVRPAKAKVRPTPTATSVPVGISAPFNVNMQIPDYKPSLTGGITVDLSGILLGIGALFSMFVVVVLFMAIQSRRSWKNNFEFKGSKLPKRAPTRNAPAQESSPGSTTPASRLGARDTTRSSPSIVADMVSVGARLTQSSQKQPTEDQGYDTASVLGPRIGDPAGREMSRGIVTSRPDWNPGSVNPGREPEVSPVLPVESGREGPNVEKPGVSKPERPPRSASCRLEGLANPKRDDQDPTDL